MKIHHFKPGTGEFLFTDDALPDPADEGRFLVPAYSTTKPLPRLKSGQKAFYLREEAKWEARTPPEEKTPAEVELTSEQKIAQLRGAAYQYANNVARKLGFDDMNEAMSYTDESAVPLYQQQALALRAWRSLFWFAYEARERAMQSGEIPAKFEDFVDSLPAFVAPPVA